MNSFDENEQFITIKSSAEILRMRAACKLAAEALKYTAGVVKPGISTGMLDRLAMEFILERGAVPASLGYRGFPKSICTSVNDVVCHGIPSDNEFLREGDIVNIDIAVILDGFHGDNSVTVPVGKIDEMSFKLITTTKGALDAAIQIVKPGLRTRAIGAVIDDYVHERGFTSVKEFVGHGIGLGYHEPPMILHYKNKEASIRLQPGMTFTIEPMINVGSCETQMMDDGWTVKTADGTRSAQFEHTILVTETGFEILTICD